MDAPTERKRVLIAMKADIIERMESIRADLDAVNRLLNFQEGNEPATLAGTVEDIRQASYELLRQHEEPMHRQTLLDELALTGVYVGGKVPVNTLGSILSRFSEDFEPHGQGVWGIKSKKATMPELPSPTYTNGHTASNIDDVDDLPF